MPDEATANQVEYTLDNCSCVSYMRLFTKFPKIRTPDDLSGNTIPFIGSLVLLNYGELPHIGVLTAFTADGFRMRHRALINGDCFTGVSAIKWNDARIRGFYTAGY
jgi:hypothetical protein